MDATVYTAIIEKEGDLSTALCPELDMASQGAKVEEATANLLSRTGSSSAPARKSYRDAAPD